MKHMDDTVLIGLAGLVLSVLTYFAGVWRTNLRHGKEDRMGRVRRVVDTYLAFRRSNQTSGFDGLQKAGIATLNSTAEIQEVIDHIVAHGEKHPFGRYETLFRGVDLLRFFRYTAEHRIDFHRHEPQNLIQESSAGP